MSVLAGRITSTVVAVALLLAAGGSWSVAAGREAMPQHDHDAHDHGIEHGGGDHHAWAPSRAASGEDLAVNMSLVAQDAYDFASGSDHRDGVFVTGAAYGGPVVDRRGPAPGSGIRIYDTKHPGSPKLLSFAHCEAQDSDVAISGDLVLQTVQAKAAEQGGDVSECDGIGDRTGVRVFDTSNPKRPQAVGFLEAPPPHTIEAVGDTGLAYLSYGDTPGEAEFHIADVSDPENPELIVRDLRQRNRTGETMLAPGCHDIGLDLDRERAFCAGYHETLILDIADPRDPVVVGTIRNAAISTHHYAEANATGDVLVINDEVGAALHNCVGGSAPLGALWFYDISDVAAPRLLGWWSPQDAHPLAEVCSSHNFEVFPDRDWVTVAWFQQGVFVLNFSGLTAQPARPVEVVGRYRPAAAWFWDARLHDGYIYATSFSPYVLTGSSPSLEGGGGLYVFSLKGYSGKKGLLA